MGVIFFILRKTAIHNFFLLCAIFVLNGTVFSQTKSRDIQTIEGKKYYIHTIEKGQSLYSISKLYNVSLDDLYNLNPELDMGAKAGQEIRIPFVSSTETVVTSTIQPIDTAKYITYKVQKGETIYSLCKRFDIKEKKLNEYNPDLTNGLKVGQIIIISEKPKRKKAKEVTVTQPTVVAIADTVRIIPKSKKTSYNIALILPFKLEEVISLDLDSLIRNNRNFPMISGLSIDFYLGFKRAMDSLKSQDFKINLQLYDIGDDDSLKLVQLVNSPKFKEFDFIFGPLYADDFKIIAKKAKEFQIPIVSPITQQNKILYDNIYISKTNPSQFTLLESLADYCMDSLMANNAHIMLLAAAEKDRKEKAFVNAFKTYFNDKQKQSGKSEKDTITVVKGIDAVKQNFVPGVRNIIVSMSGNQVLVTDFNTQLALFANKKDIVLCGWQSITEMENMDQEYLNQLNYTFPHQYNLLNTQSFWPIIADYKQQQNTCPSEYYFIGFDIGLYYLKNLKEKGPDFIFSLDKFPQETSYTRFQYARPDNSTGFDNRGVYIFKYNNYQLQKTGWK